jgi:hypothetical protein
MINTNDPRQKVRAEHLQRDAYLYVRQSTLQQVFHNTESTQRQAPGMRCNLNRHS